MPLIVQPGGGFASYPPPAPPPPTVPLGDVWSFAFAEAYQPVPVAKYLAQAGGSLADAFAIALIKNNSAVDFVFPDGEFVWRRSVSREHGLRNNLRLYARNRCVLKSLPSGPQQIFLRWQVSDPALGDGEAMQNVTIRNLEFRHLDPTEVCYAVYGYYCRNVALIGVRAVAPQPFTGGDGTRLSIAVLGAHSCFAHDLYLERAQIGLCGYGMSADGCWVDRVRCVQPNDFAVSCVGGGYGGVGSDYVRNILVTNVQCDGCVGSGVVFLGSDGAAVQQAVADIRNIECRGVYISGERAGDFPATVMRGVFFISGTQTHRIKIADVQCELSAPNHAGSTWHDAVAVHRTGAEVEFEGLEIRGVSADLTQTPNPGGIEVLGRNLRDVRVSHCDLKGGSGITLRDASQATIESCNVRGGTLEMGPWDGDVTGVAVRNCRVTTGSDHHYCVSFVSIGQHDVTEVDIDHNRLESDGSDCVIAGLSGGTFSWRATDNRFLVGAAHNAEAGAGLAYARGNQGLTDT